MDILINLINDFINCKINLQDFKNQLVHLEIVDKTAFHNFLVSYNETDHLDQRMIALLTIWFYHYQYFVYQGNHYLAFLDEIKSEISSFDFSILFENENFLIIKNDNIYFLLNNHQKSYLVNLPKSLQNIKGYCFNCNDEIALKETLKMPEYSFYIFDIN